MKLFKISFALICGLAAGILLAQTESDFQGWMKQVAATNGKLKGDIAAKNASAADSAKVLEQNFKNAEDYFTKNNMPDAAAKAKAAREAAAQTVAAIAAGNFDMAGQHAATVGSSCGGCHSQYREGDKGNYKIKK